MPIFGAAGFRAKISQSLIKASAAGLREIEVDFFINMPNSSKKQNLDGSWSKTCQDYSIATKGKISKSSFRHWTNSGMAFRGECLTLNTLEHPKGAGASMLSEVLEPSAPAKCFLTPQQIKSLVHRAEAKGKPLPAALHKALVVQMSLLSNTHQSVESRMQDRRLKDIAMTRKPTRSTQEVAQTLFVRRLMVSECEQLQGFPKGWTAIA